MPFFWKIKCLNLWKSTCRLQSGKDPAARLHRYYWELTQRKKEKPLHPGENDDFIPEEIRGKHYDSWTEIAKDLGYKKDE